jgi:hypothetical protein
MDADVQPKLPPVNEDQEAATCSVCLCDCERCRVSGCRGRRYTTSYHMKLHLLLCAAPGRGCAALLSLFWLASCLCTCPAWAADEAGDFMRRLPCNHEFHKCVLQPCPPALLARGSAALQRPTPACRVSCLCRYGVGFQGFSHHTVSVLKPQIPNPLAWLRHAWLRTPWLHSAGSASING